MSCNGVISYDIGDGWVVGLPQFLGGACIS